MVEIASIVSLVLLITGILAAVRAICFWKSVESRYVDRAKFGVAIARYLSAILALLLKLSPATHAVLAYGVLIAASAWLVWEVVQYVVERKLKDSLVALNDKLLAQGILATQLRRQIDIRASMASSLRSLVNDKKQRLREMATPSETPLKRLRRLSECLRPEEHMIAILGALALPLRALHQTPGSAEASEINFRIGLYVPQDGHMAPWIGLDLGNKDYDPFSSYEKHRERFALDNHTNQSHTVRCVQEKRTLIRPDTVAEGMDFFEERQKNYLKTLVAHPISGLREPSGEIVDAALVIDGNKAGLFKENDRELLELLLGEFSSRLILESQFLGKCDL